MRLKRTITEAEFAAAIPYLRTPSKLTLDMARADLVRGINQDEIARKHNRTKGTVSQASKRVWLGVLKSKGYEVVRVVLPEVRAFIVEDWQKDALHELNYGTQRPERKPRRSRRPSTKAARPPDQ